MPWGLWPHPQLWGLQAVTRHAGSGEAQRNSGHGQYLVLESAIFQGLNERLNTRVLCNIFLVEALAAIPYIVLGWKVPFDHFSQHSLELCQFSTIPQVILRAKTQDITWHVSVLNMAIGIAVDFIAVIHGCSSIDLWVWVSILEGKDYSLM